MRDLVLDRQVFAMAKGNYVKGADRTEAKLDMSLLGKVPVTTHTLLTHPAVLL